MSLHPFPDLPPPDVDPTVRIVLLRSIWYGDLTQAMVDDALTALVSCGVPRERITIITTPGSYELPLLCQQALEAGADGAIAFGIIMQGATQHAQHVAAAVAHGLMDVQLRLGKPVLCEVLHVASKDDAAARAIGPGAKGPFAARALLHSLANARKMRS